MDDEQVRQLLEAIQRELEGQADDFDPTMGGVFTIEQALLFGRLATTKDTVTVEEIPVSHIYAAVVALLWIMPHREMSKTLAHTSFLAANGFTSLLDDAYPGAGDALQALQRFFTPDDEFEDE